MTETDLQKARENYLAKHRKAKDARKAKRAETRNPNGRRKVPRAAPPPLNVEPRAWPEDEKAQWCERLINAIGEGGSVSAFVREHPQGPPRITFYRWLQDDASLWNRYAQAREVSADTLADDCVLIADEVKDAGQFDSARVNAARLRVDARKWVASKLKPKTYADRIETVQSGTLTVEHRLSDDDRARALQAIAARQAAAQAPNLIEAQRMIEATAKDVTPKDRQRKDESEKDGPSKKPGHTSTGS